MDFRIKGFYALAQYSHRAVKNRYGLCGGHNDKKSAQYYINRLFVYGFYCISDAPCRGRR